MDRPASVENVSFVSHNLSNRSWCAAYLMQPIFSGWDRLPAKILLLLRFSVNQNARGAPIGHSQDGFGWRPGGPLLGRLSVDRMARLARPRRPRGPASGRRSDRGPALIDGVTNLLWLYPTPCRRRDGAGTVRCGLRARPEGLL